MVCPLFIIAASQKSRLHCPLQVAAHVAGSAEPPAGGSAGRGEAHGRPAAGGMHRGGAGSGRPAKKVSIRVMCRAASTQEVILLSFSHLPNVPLSTIAR